MSEVLPPPNTRDGQHLALIYEQLRTAILRGELVPGEALSQATLAREFNAGRTPYRWGVAHGHPFLVPFFQVCGHPR